MQGYDVAKLIISISLIILGAQRRYSLVLADRRDCYSEFGHLAGSLVSFSAPMMHISLREISSRPLTSWTICRRRVTDVMNNRDSFLRKLFASYPRGLYCIWGVRPVGAMG